MLNGDSTSTSMSTTTKSNNNSLSPVKRAPPTSKPKTKPKYYVKITRNKAQKCKFNANNRSFQKPVDFVLAEEHFLKTTDEVPVPYELHLFGKVFATLITLFGFAYRGVNLKIFYVKIW
jgi:hypothetical protein